MMMMNDEDCVMHSKSDNMKIMINGKTDEGSKFVFDYVRIFL